MSRLARGSAADAERVERLQRVLRPRSVALIGATEKTNWTAAAINSLLNLGFDGPLHLVSRRGEPVLGRETVTSCREIAEPVDLAVMLVANAAVPDALRDAAAAGAAGAVLLGSGYGETGAEGLRAESQLRDLARELDVTLIGPNCLGFLNLLDRAGAWVGRTPEPLIDGSIALVSQSGNIAASVADFFAAQHIGLSHVVSTGNQVDVDLIDVLAALVDDDRVRVMAVFAESIDRPARFLEVAAQAADAGKAIVVLKVGASELAAELAKTHTGALAGDDAVVDAALRDAGVIRVRSIEQLAVTAALIAHTGRVGPGGLGVVSQTGGGNDIIADRAEAVGVAIPAVGAVTQDALRSGLDRLGFATMQNPLDLTGAAVRAVDMWTSAVGAFRADPGIALTIAVFFLPPDGREEFRMRYYRAVYDAIAAGCAGPGGPGVLVVNTLDPVSPDQHQVLVDCGIPHVAGGIDHTLAAVADLFTWSAWHRERLPARDEPSAASRGTIESPSTERWTEADGLDLVAAHGVPVVPWRRAADVEAAVEAARDIGYPVVVKVLSPDILHKSDIGGVEVGLADDAAVAAAFERVTAAGKAVDGARVEGAIVAAMRGEGVELIVGAVNDRSWGPTIAVGFGGVWVNVLNDTHLSLLPVSRASVRRALLGLRGAQLLQGFRGTPAVDLDAVADAVVAVGELVVGLGDELESLEINPLIVHGSRVEALDAAATWRQ